VTGAAAGTVTVRSGGKVICVITIRGGTGTCKINSLQFTPGTVQFTGTYAGPNGVKGKTGTTNLKLVKATTRTSLTLAAATVKYGSEQATQLSVRVVPQYSGAPGGSVTVRSGSAVVCVITLSNGAGSCKLTARQLAPGSYHLVASYPGSTDFIASASATQSLSVSK
jgi:hypothetical protein